MTATALRLFDVVPVLPPLFGRPLPELTDGFPSLTWEALPGGDDAVMRCDVCDWRCYVDADDPGALLVVVAMHDREQCEQYRHAAWSANDLNPTGTVGLAPLRGMTRKVEA